MAAPTGEITDPTAGKPPVVPHMKCLTSRLLIVLFAFSAFTGCAEDAARPATQPVSSDPPQTFEIALFGDPSRLELLKEIVTAGQSTVEMTEDLATADIVHAGTHYRFRLSRDDSVAAHSALAWESDLALIAVGATVGPTPMHREQILLLRQMEMPGDVVVFTKSKLVDDPELLELEELELRELLNKYGRSGDSVRICMDHADARSSSQSKILQGPKQLLESLSAIVRKRELKKQASEVRHFHATVYSPAAQESFRREDPTPLRNGPTTVLIRNETIAANLISCTEIPPGTDGNVELVFEMPVRIGIHQRFVLLDRDHVVGVGVVRDTISDEPR